MKPRSTDFPLSGGDVEQEHTTLAVCRRVGAQKKVYHDQRPE